MIGKRYLNTVAGSNTVASAILAFVEILHVERDGIGHNRIGLFGSFTEREYKHNSAHGLFIFDPLIPFNPGEKIYVMFKREI